jgi:hypothetical protein
MTYEEIITGLRTLAPSDFDYNNIDARGGERLSELTDALMATPGGSSEAAIQELFSVMPSLLPTGPEQMLERAKANGLIVPLAGYKIYVYGATPNGLSPQAWLAVKAFWTMYFAAAGAELVSYSAECDVQR